MSKKFLSNIEIAAGIKITSGSPGVGKVLTSDADGDAAWDDAPGGGTLDAVPTDGSTNGVESNGVFDALATKQATLVSGTNIKTLGYRSILGSGNLDELFIKYHWGFHIIAGFTSVTINAVGSVALTSAGNVSSRTFATTNIQTSTRRVGVVSNATAGQVASLRINQLHAWRGNGAGLGGFDFIIRFGISQTQTGYLFFAGMCPQTTAYGATTLPADFTNIAGISFAQGTDTNFQVTHNDGSGTATKVDTGMAPSTTTMYTLRVKCEPNASTIDVILTDIQSGTEFSTSISTNLPADTQGLTYQIHMSNNATAAAVSFEFAESLLGTPS